MDDRELVKEVLAGNQRAMRDLIVKYQDLVVNTCYQVLHNQHDAEDVAQEVFLTAYHSMAALRNEKCLSFWLYRIALNKSLNYSRKHRIFKKGIRFDPPCEGHYHEPETQVPDREDSPHEIMENNEKMEVISLMIDTLPARQRKAFILHHIERLSYREIAEVLNLSLPTVESLIFRARSTLKTRCRAYYEFGNNTD